MFLSCLHIDNFRNFGHNQIEFNSSCNLFYGNNGSGKTSILEAIYYLILGRSFRSHLLRRITKYQTDGFRLFGKINQQHNIIPVGIERSLTNSKRIRISGEDVASVIEITKLLPLQLLNQNSYSLLDGGPKIRRQFIDWGLFHVEQNFLTLWRRTERVIEQRNAAIRSGSSKDHIRAWDGELSELGVKIHQLREQYIAGLLPIIATILQQLLQNIAIDIRYFAGWNIESSLTEILANNITSDLSVGYTTAGPHRADLRITVNKVPVKDALSRGQQKLLAYGMQIAQGILLKNLTSKNCIYLIDDLPAELDEQKRSLIAGILLDLDSQIFVTGLSSQNLADFVDTQSYSMFHVEHGVIVQE